MTKPIPDPLAQVQYVMADGTLDPVFYALLKAMIDRINELEQRVSALEP